MNFQNERVGAKVKLCVENMDHTRKMQMGKGSPHIPQDQITFQKLMGPTINTDRKRFDYKEGICKSIWLAKYED